MTRSVRASKLSMFPTKSYSVLSNKSGAAETKPWWRLKENVTLSQAIRRWKFMTHEALLRIKYVYEEQQHPLLTLSRLVKLAQSLVGTKAPWSR